MITWDDPADRLFSTGIDRGVLYPDYDTLNDFWINGVAWNGLIGADEAANGSSTVLYRDGNIYYSDIDPGDYTGTLTAYFWPDQLNEKLGMPEAAPGLILDYQKPKPFSFSYRTLIGSGARGDMFGYQIHLFYNVVAVVGNRTRKTHTENQELDQFAFDITATPQKITGYRPTAHLVFDTRGLAPDMLNILEYLLYENSVLPSANTIYEFLKYGQSITFTESDGIVTATGASHVIAQNGGAIEIVAVNGTDNGDGSLTLQDTIYT